MENAKSLKLISSKASYMSVKLYLGNHMLITSKPSHSIRQAKHLTKFIKLKTFELNN